MSELQGDYVDRVEFVIVPAEETAVRGDELEQYFLASRGHGLVAFDQAREPVVIIAGHRFGREEIEMAVAQVLEP